MGRYNPNKPAILGLEWTPLINAPIDIDTNTEWGYSFTVTGAPTIIANQAVLLVNQPTAAIAGQTLFCSIYPRGREDDTGQINVVRFLVRSVTVTGAVVTGGAVSFTDALLTSSDTGALVFDALADRARASFDVSAAVLTGKRILGMDLVYQAAGTPGFALEPTLESFNVVYPYGPLISGPPTLDIAQASTIRLGDANPFWNSASDPDVETTRMPWRSTEITRLDGTAPRVFVGIRPSTIPLGGNAQLGFLALDVYYCDEARVRYGGVACGSDILGLNFTPIPSTQVVTVPLRDTNFQVTGGLAAGDYTVTLTQADVGSRFNGGGRINLPRTYQLNAVATHPGVQITKFQRPVGVKPVVAPVSAYTQYMTPVAMIDSIGGTNLQAGNASVTYTSIISAPVYIGPGGASVFAQQPIHNEASPSDTTYEQVRFYARRFNPTAPGNLTVTVSGSGSATITPTDFAALPEINLGVNGAGTGWREITLPITATFSSDATFRPVTWTMTGVTAGSPIDQWQILGESLTLAPVYPNFGSYQSCSYDGLMNTSLTWDNGRTGGTVQADANANATVFFSQSPAAPTGMAISARSQVVTGIGLDCGLPPACIPTGIGYNRVTWGLDSLSLCDSFSSRTVTGSWGTSETGQPWTFTGTGATPFVSGGVGYINVTVPAGASTVFMTAGSFVDSDETMTFTVPAIPTVSSYRVGMVARYTNTSNWYMARIELNTNGIADLELYRNVAGVTMELTQLNSFLPFAAGTRISVRFQVTDGVLRAKTWNPDAGPEPLTWTLSISDSLLTGPGAVGIRISEDATSLPAPYLLAFDDFRAARADIFNGQFEIQRMDDVDQVWQTVLLSPLCTTKLDDYEVRVGVPSQYRIRIVNASGFAGPWSTPVRGTLAAPGVFGTSRNGDSVLILTSNLGPSGNLAYAMTWDGAAREEFAFPEAEAVELRTQYQRDFYTAFHGTERGGETFERTILVQAAAIPAESLANFRTLRDLAWANLPYICLRDELGNRWFANVRVPTGVVSRNRRLYVANISVTEVTQTPAPVTS